MTLSISRGFLLPLSLVLAANTLIFPAWSVVTPSSVAPAPVKAECPICGMRFSAKAKTSFFTKHDGKDMHLCSFACAAKLADHDAKAPFTVLDYRSERSVPGESAYFLIRSKKIQKELEFDMPPSVVAFSDEKAAKDEVKRLGDGEVVQGWTKLKKTLAP